MKDILKFSLFKYKHESLWKTLWMPMTRSQWTSDNSSTLRGARGGQCTESFPKFLRVNSRGIVYRNACQLRCIISIPFLARRWRGVLGAAFCFNSFNWRRRYSISFFEIYEREKFQIPLNKGGKKEKFHVQVHYVSKKRKENINNHGNVLFVVPCML